MFNFGRSPRAAHREIVLQIGPSGVTEVSHGSATTRPGNVTVPQSRGWSDSRGPTSQNRHQVGYAPTGHVSKVGSTFNGNPFNSGLRLTSAHQDHYTPQRHGSNLVRSGPDGPKYVGHQTQYPPQAQGPVIETIRSGPRNASLGPPAAGHRTTFLTPYKDTGPTYKYDRSGMATGSSPKVNRTSTKMGDRKFIDEALRAHNKYRANHGAPALKLNDDICRTAQKWADHLAATNSMGHSNGRDRQYNGDQMGENIAMKYDSRITYYSGQEATDQWYSEIEKYNFQRHSGAGTGHFTQVVWKDSKEFGIGMAKTRDGKFLVVANYYPAGNFIGRNAENVFPPRDGKYKAPASSSNPSSGAQPPSSVSHYKRDRSPEVTQSSRAASRQVRTETRNGVTKTIITETFIEPDGSKRTVTKEETKSDGGSGGASNSSRFKSSGFGDDDSFGRKFRDMGFGGRDDFFKDSPSSDNSRTVSQTYVSSEPDKKDKKGKEPKPQKIKDFIEDVVKAHNKYRKLHKVGDLKHNKEMSVLAQRWADHLAAKSSLGHSNDTYKGEPLGENVATKWSSAGTDYTGQDATEQWYEEISKYDFGAARFMPGTGHFTQVVWKGSKEIGVGKSFGSDGRVFCVCNYFPAGNVQGQFPDNVFPPKK